MDIRNIETKENGRITNGEHRELNIISNKTEYFELSNLGWWIYEIDFSKHANMKIKERKISEKDVEKVLKEPDLVFYDLFTRGLISIGKIQIEGISTNLIVVYTKQENTIKVITAYPCTNIAKEIKKKEVRRWIKIR